MLLKWSHAFWSLGIPFDPQSVNLPFHTLSLLSRWVFIKIIDNLLIISPHPMTNFNHLPKPQTLRSSKSTNINEEEVNFIIRAQWSLALITLIGSNRHSNESSLEQLTLLQPRFRRTSNMIPKPFLWLITQGFRWLSNAQVDMAIDGDNARDKAALISLCFALESIKIYPISIREVAEKFLNRRS